MQICGRPTTSLMIFSIFMDVQCACSSLRVCVWEPPTHGSRKNDNPQHIHAFAGARWCFHDDIRRRREIQGEVLHICAVVVLDAVNVDPACGGLVQELSHRWFGDELGDSLGSILETEAENRPKRQYRKQWEQQMVSEIQASRDEMIPHICRLIKQSIKTWEPSFGLLIQSLWFIYAFNKMFISESFVRQFGQTEPVSPCVLCAKLSWAPAGRSLIFSTDVYEW